MNKTSLIYIIVSVLSFLIMNAILFFLLKDRLIMHYQLQQQDQPAVVQPDTLIAVQDSILPVDTLTIKDNTLPDPLSEYKEIMKLKQELLKVFNDSIEYSTVKVDSVKAAISAEIDSLINKQQQYVKRINDLSILVSDKQNEVIVMQEKITLLEENISQLNTQQQQDVTQTKTQDAEEAISYLASTYDTMDPADVAKLMDSLPDDKIISIMKKMNQRKVGKVLAALPTSRAVILTKLMAE